MTTPTTKTVSIEELKPGMFVERLDQSWLKTPFLRHRFLIQDDEEIARLKACGIRQVVIDPARGRDVASTVNSSTALGGAETAQTHQQDPVPAAGSQAGAPPSPEAISLATTIQMEADIAARHLLEGISAMKPMDAPRVHKTIQLIQDRLTQQPTAMLTSVRLRQLQEFDANLFTHAVNVTVLSLAVAVHQGLGQPDLEELAWGALLHDLGELRLPRNLVSKAGPYTEPERVLMRHHPQLGVALLAGAENLSERTRRIIHEHHERVDGTGYPEGLRHDAIAPMSQLVGLMDVYDALVSSRRHRPAYSPPQAIRYLYQLGQRGQFEKTLLAQVIGYLGVYPIGSVVDLNTGERAVVVDVKPRSTVKPCLRLISDAEGRRYPKMRFIDLSVSDPDGPIRTITRDVGPSHAAGGAERVAGYLVGSH